MNIYFVHEIFWKWPDMNMNTYQQNVARSAAEISISISFYLKPQHYQNCGGVGSFCLCCKAYFEYRNEIKWNVCIIAVDSCSNFNGSSRWIDIQQIRYVFPILKWKSFFFVFFSVSFDFTIHKFRIVVELFSENWIFNIQRLACGFPTWFFPSLSPSSSPFDIFYFFIFIELENVRNVVVDDDVTLWMSEMS